MSPQEALSIILEREHLRRTGFITVVVGTWLTLFNQMNPLMAGTIDWPMVLKIFLNYLTPFVVSNAGLLSRQADD